MVTIRTTTVEHQELRILSKQCVHDLLVIPVFNNHFLPIRPILFFVLIEAYCVLCEVRTYSLHVITSIDKYKHNY
jgi:hypothetical protein